MFTRSATLAGAVLLAGVPVFGAGVATAQAKPPQEVKVEVGPCRATLGSSADTVTGSVDCRETKTVGVVVEIDGETLSTRRQRVEAGVRHSVTVKLPQIPEVCITLEVDGETGRICLPSRSQG
ncbi:hypothetical protein GCM10010446_15690 [Streptomyces enissocaesilis]|uniref:Secreted protein n=1 Tax=Streptomyces enissocaesilis TaxID=332589 RepID=A0ABP6JIK6_9ACTN